MLTMLWQVLSVGSLMIVLCTFVVLLVSLLMIMADIISSHNGANLKDGLIRFVKTTLAIILCAIVLTEFSVAPWLPVLAVGCYLIPFWRKIATWIRARWRAPLVDENRIDG